jgi:hypothetical protein
VEVREGEQRDEAGASVQGQAMRVGEIAEPATDDDTSEQII